MALSRDQILAAPDLPAHSVRVPEWGGDVFVRSMTGAERDAFEAAIFDGDKVNRANIRARLVSLCAVDDKGDRLFSEADIEALGKKSAAALERVYAAASRLNALSPADVEELAKNSRTGRDDDSPSTSPATSG